MQGTITDPQFRKERARQAGVASGRRRRSVDYVGDLIAAAAGPLY